MAVIEMPPGTRDLRSLARPDEPFSACCATCGEPVYSLWIEPQCHGHMCPTDPTTCWHNTRRKQREIEFKEGQSDT